MLAAGINEFVIKECWKCMWLSTKLRHVPPLPPTLTSAKRRNPGQVVGTRVPSLGLRRE